MFSNTKCLDDAENYCTFFRNKAKNAGRSRKNAVMQSNKATCGISRTIVGRLTPMLASYTYTCIAPLGEYISKFYACERVLLPELICFGFSSHL